MNLVVADAGPIIHLHEICSLELLTLFDSVLVPDQVWDECTAHNRVPTAELQEVGCVTRYQIGSAEVDAFAQLKRINNLHGGERSALALCEKSGAKIILTDDLAVRNIAGTLKLTPIGTLGIVFRACRDGRKTIEQGKQLILQLEGKSTLFVTPGLVQFALQQLDTLH
ncbi:MAG TPA: hypothetical protein VEK08_01255 [Planctomycetota bacterium]|nr:hypothetical protein [Planctomycetota bacterium]